ncbi:hypothetical protein A9Z50_13455 [Aeromonas hydrophila]|nr:hypothetical protein [Aeromonas hydrophila]
MSGLFYALLAGKSWGFFWGNFGAVFIGLGQFWGKNIGGMRWHKVGGDLLARLPYQRLQGFTRLWMGFGYLRLITMPG